MFSKCILFIGFTCSPGCAESHSTPIFRVLSVVFLKHQGHIYSSSLLAFFLNYKNITAFRALVILLCIPTLFQICVLHLADRVKPIILPLLFPTPVLYPRQGASLCLHKQLDVQLFTVSPLLGTPFLFLPIQILLLQSGVQIPSLPTAFSDPAVLHRSLLVLEPSNNSLHHSFCP